MEQLKPFDPTVPAFPEGCLDYVHRGYGIGNKYPTAIANWNASQTKHLDRNFPTGCSVPVWFTLKTDPRGHVASLQPDGSVWSDSIPTGTKALHEPSIDALIKYYGSEGLSYLGWTEDVNDVAVIKENDMATNEQIDEWISLFYQEAYGAAPTDAVFADWRKVLSNNFVEGSLSIMQGTDTNAGALKNKPTGFTPITEQLYSKT